MKRELRILEIMFGLFVGISVLLVLLLDSEPFKKDVKTYLTNYIKQETGYIVEIGELKLLPLGTVQLKHVRVERHLEPIVAVDLLEAKIKFRDLFKDTLTLTHFDLNGIAATDPSLANAHHSPLRIKGNLSVGLDGESGVAFFDFIHMDEPENRVASKISFQNKRGLFQFIMTDKARAEGEFSFDQTKGLRLSALRGNFGPAHIGGNLKVSKEGFLDGSRLHLTHFDLDQLPIEATGVATGSLTLSGKFSSPSIDLNASIPIVDTFERQFQDVELNIRGKYAFLKFLGTASLKFTSNHVPYAFDLEYQLDNRGKESQAHFASGIELSDLRHLTGIDLPDIEGNIHLELDLSPHLFEYLLTFNHGSFETDKMAFTDIHASLRGNKERLLLQSLSAKDELGGIYRATGRVEYMENFPFTIEGSIANGTITDWKTATTHFRGNLTLKGDQQGAELTGKLYGYDAVLNLPKKSRKDPITVDVTYIGNEIVMPIEDETPQYPIQVNVELETETPIQIVSSDFYSHWMGTVQIKGLLPNETYHGQIDLTEGMVEAGGKTFELTSGSLFFDGDLKQDTKIAMNGSIEIETNTIELLVRGHTSEPTFSLRSTPPMSQREILSWILFNRGIRDLSAAESESLSRSLPTFKPGNSGSTDLLTKIKQSTGLDRIDIVASEEDTSRFSLNVGKYITNRTMVSLSRNLTNTDEEEGQNRVRIETTVTPNVTIRAEVDDDNNGLLNLMWKKDY